MLMVPVTPAKQDSTIYLLLTHFNENTSVIFYKCRKTIVLNQKQTLTSRDEQQVWGYIFNLLCITVRSMCELWGGQIKLQQISIPNFSSENIPLFWKIRNHGEN